MDWTNKMKYGITTNYAKRILDSHEQHSYLSDYDYSNSEHINFPFPLGFILNLHDIHLNLLF